MTNSIGICALGFMLVSAAAAGDGRPVKGGDQEDDLLSFVAGSYEVIGRRPESKETYNGRVSFTRQGQTLEIVRTINGKDTRGQARIMTVTADDIPVLQAEFTEDNTPFKVTYLISSDLDNYGRFTGYVYFTEKNTTVPGLEALFADTPERK